MNKKESDAAEMDLANLMVRSAEDTPIMMGNTKPMVITGVVKIAKPFDITKHEWSEYNQLSSETDSECVVIDVDNCPYGWAGFSMYKDDAIALAKHFKLTPEDLT